jgi:predicted DNA-binding transcriptional regulator AlpA
MTITKFVTYPELPRYGVPAFSRKHLLDLQKRGKFPLARQLTTNRIAWVEDDILAWVASRPVARAVAASTPRFVRRSPLPGA